MKDIYLVLSFKVSSKFIICGDIIEYNNIIAIAVMFLCTMHLC